MSDTVIRVQNLSKRYRIGLEEEVPDTLAATAAGFLKRPLRNLRRLRRLTRFGQDGHNPDHSPHDVIWALKDVSFEVERGEVVGIIGRNGAGKSTLLKILSRITHPTSGRVELRGRVSSLLEVGTGFHAELTGRENIYLNGTVLGMSKAEVDRKFDEIVAFSGVEKFIDTPVKRYSSGMKVRLAFAVAAHLEPEILLVDEVLAVGDIAFQKKCLGKMGDVVKEGRTVLFVSHNMGAISNLCRRSMLLDAGQLTMDQSSERVIDAYLSENRDNIEGGEVELEPRSSDAYFTRIAALDPQGEPRGVFSVRSGLFVCLDYVLKKTIDGLEVSFSLLDRKGNKIFYCPRSTGADQNDCIGKGKYRSKVWIPGEFLAPGNYYLTIGLHIPNVQLFDRRSRALSFRIVETGTNHYRIAGRNIGSILVNLKWDTQKIS